MNQITKECDWYLDTFIFLCESISWLKASIYWTKISVMEFAVTDRIFFLVISRERPKPEEKNMTNIFPLSVLCWLLGWVQLSGHSCEH